MLETKPEIRARFMRLRSEASVEDRTRWSSRICHHFEDFCTRQHIQHIGAFWPLGSEIDLRPLIQSHPDWTFFFPRITSTKPPRLAWGSEPLEPSTFKLMEPILAPHALPPVQLLIVPGLAFDAAGYRIGYGKGFYDALLERLDKQVITLGAGFQLQRTACLPLSPQDLPIQGLVTEEGLSWFRQTEA